MNSKLADWIQGNLPEWIGIPLTINKLGEKEGGKGNPQNKKSVSYLFGKSSDLIKDLKEEIELVER